MLFSSPYYNSLDRGYYPPGEARSEPLGVEVNSMPAIYPESNTPDVTDDQGVPVSIRDIGQGVPMGIAAANVAGVDAKLRAGMGHIELQFPGAVRSNRQSQTPEIYGEDQRLALRELRKVREVDFTTHASFGIMGFAGQDQQGNYSKEQRKIAMDEVKKAITFAADVAGGGSVVVHTGEFQRPISEAVTPVEQWRYQTDQKGRVRTKINPETGLPEPVPMFKGYEEEQERAIIRVVDDRTGQVMQNVRKNQKIATAEWNQVNKGNWESKWKKQIGEERELTYSIPDNPEWQKKWKGIKDDNLNYYFTKDSTGKVIPGKRRVQWGDYLDYQNKIIVDPLDVEHGRLPEYDADSGRFVVKMREWNYFVDESAKWNELENQRRVKQGNKPVGSYDKVTPEERYLRATLETQEGYARGWALQFSVNVKESIERAKKLQKALEFYESLEESIPDAEKWKLLQQSGRMREIDSLLPSETKMPSVMLKKAIWEEKRNLAYFQESGLSQEKQSKDLRENQIHIKSAWKYALHEAEDSYAKLGIFAMDESKKKAVDEPLMITMENIYPETYGGHPQELKELIEKSRERMVDLLTKKEIVDPYRRDHDDRPLKVENPHFRNISRDQAAKMAETHIKATIDTGHLNIWRKYFQGTDKEFDKWYLEQIEDLAKKKMIGNVHLADNYGYQDEHLSPGQGNAPVKEVVAILKKYGYDHKMIVEPGGAATTDNSDFHGLMQTWRYFGNLAAPTAAYLGTMRGNRPETWTDIQNAYFGRTYTPNFVFGSYTPSQDWRLWSEVPLE